MSKKSKKYNYLGYTSTLIKTPTIIKGVNIKEVDKLGISFFCSCGSVTEIVENVKNSSVTTETLSECNKLDSLNSKSRTICKKCNGKSQSDITISLGHKLYQNNIKCNYNVFLDGNLIKLVRFEDFLGVNSKGTGLYMTTNKSSICFNKQTGRFYYYRSYRKNAKVVSIGLKDIAQYLDEFLHSTILNQKVCGNSSNKVNLFRNIQKDYVNPLNEFFNMLLKHIDKRDVKRLTCFLKFFKLSDLPTSVQLKSHNPFLHGNAYSLKESLIRNFELLISLIQYPNLSVLLFGLKEEKYLDLIKKSPPVSFFKKNKDLSKAEIVQNLYLGQVIYYKRLMLKDFRVSDLELNLNEGKKLSYRDIKKIYSEILGLENFSKYSIDLKPLQEITKRQKLNLSSIDTFDIELDNELDCIFASSVPNMLFNLKTIEQADYYIKFLRSQKIPKHIIRDSIKSSENVLIESCRVYFLMLYNEILNEKEFCFLSKQYGLHNLVNILNEFFNILDYCEHYNYAKSHEDAKESSVFIKHFFKLLFHKKDRTLLEDGFERSSFIRIYKDAIDMLESREMGFDGILKCKTVNEVRDLHNYWSQIISLEKMEKFNKGIKEFSKQYDCINEYSEDNINFKLIDNINSLSEEGSVMRHCVKTYARGMAQGKYLIFSVKDLSTQERATLQFRAKPEKNGLVSWTFEQLKGKFNSQSSQRLIDSIKLFVDNFLLKNNIKVNIKYKEWDLIIGDVKEKSLHERHILAPEIFDMANEEMDYMIEDFYLDEDLPF
tara:strand:- start:752 stop:3064 length:2313 start_codon:yes stop_codon:yes gene_type:complete